MTLVNLQKFLEEVVCVCHEAGTRAARAALMIHTRRSPFTNHTQIKHFPPWARDARR